MSPRDLDVELRVFTNEGHLYFSYQRVRVGMMLALYVNRPSTCASGQSSPFAAEIPWGLILFQLNYVDILPSTRSHGWSQAMKSVLVTRARSAGSSSRHCQFIPYG
jgi:hypothetical protein